MAVVNHFAAIPRMWYWLPQNGFVFRRADVVVLFIHAFDGVEGFQQARCGSANDDVGRCADQFRRQFIQGDAYPLVALILEQYLRRVRPAPFAVGDAASGIGGEVRHTVNDVEAKVVEAVLFGY